MKQKTFENIPQQIKKPSLDDGRGMTRREVLKKAGALAAGMVCGIAGTAIVQKNKERAIPASKEGGEDQRSHNVVEHIIAPSREQLTIRRDDDEVIGQTFAEQLQTQDAITLDRSTRKAIYAKWYEKYKPDTYNYTHGLIPAMERMQPWLNEMRAEFQAQNVPEEFMYLAIAESHFSTTATSAKAAVGPFQITKHTSSLPALKTTLTIIDNYDERRDPVMSARLCAQHLRYSYEHFGHDWQLALMDYNGGFTNDYIHSIALDEKRVDITPQTVHFIAEGETLYDLAKKYETSITLLKRANDLTDDAARKIRPDTSLIIPQKRTPITFDHFNQWLEDRINAAIDRAKAQSIYTVKKGDTTTAIAARFGIQRHLLESINNINSSFITEGQEITIPEVFDQKRERILHVLSDYRENINYPDKFYAIRDIIKENALDKIYTDTAEHRTVRITTLPQYTPTTLQHTIAPGESMHHIARAITTQIKKTDPTFDRSSAVIMQMLAQQNHITNIHSIRSGVQLTLTVPIKKPPTLEDIARAHNVSTQQLHTDNPAVIDPYTALPRTLALRITS